MKTLFFRKSLPLYALSMIALLALGAVWPGLAAGPALAASDTVIVQLNGEVLNSRFDVPPMVVDGRTLVPLRAIFEAMGATVEWEDATQTVTATKGDTTVIMTVGSLSPTVNGEVWPLQVPAQIVNERTLAPLRFVGESLGGTVVWDDNTSTAFITTGDTPPPPAGFNAADVVAAFQPSDCTVSLDITAVNSSGDNIPLKVEGQGSINASGTGSINILVYSTSFVYSLVFGERRNTVDGFPFSELIYGPASAAENVTGRLSVSEDGQNYYLSGTNTGFPESVNHILKYAIEGVDITNVSGSYKITVNKNSMQVSGVNITSVTGDASSQEFGNLDLSGTGSISFAY